jgi:hypothetical protein
MINFRTAVDLPEFKKKMGYREPSMMIGSCFAESIGTYLEELCFPIMVNPFGTLYNPTSIANSLEDLLNKKEFTEQDLFFHNGLYNSFSHHSRFSDSDPDRALKQINSRVEEASANLETCHHLFITFGTAWVFERKINGTVVSNCHKLPASNFHRFRLSVEQITERWIPLIDQLRRINPNLHLVYTVSPIRHLKDGSHDNQLSKSTLLLAIEAIILHYGEDVISYFPSYELVLDELRDYRFYASDMTHPSEVAIDFIREKFISVIMDQEAKTILSELGNILPALRHKALNNNDKSYLSFIESQVEKTDHLQVKYPFVDLKRLIKKLNEKRVV